MASPLVCGNPGRQLQNGVHRTPILQAESSGQMDPSSGNLGRCGCQSPAAAKHLISRVELAGID